MIELKNIVKEYTTKDSKVIALKNINLSFGESGIVLIGGECGAGKTTLLNIIGLISEQTYGDILHDNTCYKTKTQKEIDQFRVENISYITQHPVINNELTVEEIVSQPLVNIGVGQSLIRKKTSKILETFNIDNIKLKKVKELSSGQKQKVLLASALIKEPKILIADEPFCMLSYQESKEILKILETISKDTLIFLTNNNNFVKDIDYSQIVELQNGELKNNSVIKTNDAIEKELIPTKSVKLKKVIKNIFKDSIREKIIMGIFFSFVASLLILSLSLVDTIENKTHEMQRKLYLYSPISCVAENDDDLNTFKMYLDSDNSTIEDNGNIVYKYNEIPSIYPFKYSANAKALNFDFGYDKENKSTNGVFCRCIVDDKIVDENYSLVGGNLINDKEKEILVCLDEDGKVSDYLLYSLGLLDKSDVKNKYIKIDEDTIEKIVDSKLKYGLPSQGKSHDVSKMNSIKVSGVVKVIKDSAFSLDNSEVLYYADFINKYLKEEDISTTLEKVIIYPFNFESKDKIESEIELFNENVNSVDRIKKINNAIIAEDSVIEHLEIFLFLLKVVLYISIPMLVIYYFILFMFTKKEIDNRYFYWKTSGIKDTILKKSYRLVMNLTLLCCLLINIGLICIFSIASGLTVGFIKTLIIFLLLFIFTNIINEVCIRLSLKNKKIEIAN